MANLTSVGVTSGVPSSGTGTVSTLDNLIGTAGTPSAQVLSVQGRSGGTAIPISDNSGSLTVDGLVTVNLQDGNANAITSGTRGSEQALTVQIVDDSGNQITTFGGSGGTASSYGSAFPSSGTAIGATDGTNMVGLTAIDSAPDGSEKALVVTLSPNGLNPNGRALPSNSAPFVAATQGGQFVAASQSAVQLGSTGSSSDYLDGILVIPATSAAGAVSVKWDGSNTRTVFAGGGTTALPTLAPIYIPFGFTSGDSGGFKVTTNANVSIIAVGNFT